MRSDLRLASNTGIHVFPIGAPHSGFRDSVERGNGGADWITLRFLRISAVQASRRSRRKNFLSFFLPSWLQRSRRCPLSTLRNVRSWYRPAPVTALNSFAYQTNVLRFEFYRSEKEIFLTVRHYAMSHHSRNHVHAPLENQRVEDLPDE